MRVLHVIGRLGTGGAEVMLRRFVEESATLGHEPVVVALTPTTPKSGPCGADGRSLEAEIKGLGVEVVTLNVNAYKAVSEMRKLAAVVRGSRFDVIQSWMYASNLFSTVARTLFRLNVPVVWSIHHSLHDMRSESKKIQRVIWLSRHLSRRPDHTVYVSNASADQHAKYGFSTNRHTVIPNGYDTRLFQRDDELGDSLRAELGLRRDTFVVSSVGRLHPMKDHDNLLRAASLFLKRVPNSVFLVAGPGPDASRENLMKRIHQMGLDSQVRFLGERRDIQRIMCASDLITSSSAFGEAFPIVIGEAMACETPCVVTDVGDSAILVDDTGRVVPPRDPQALADAWLTHYEAGEQERAALGKRARERILSQYSIGSVVKKYYSLYQDLTA